MRTVKKNTKMKTRKASSSKGYLTLTGQVFEVYNALLNKARQGGTGRLTIPGTTSLILQSLGFSDHATRSVSALKAMGLIAVVNRVMYLNGIPYTHIKVRTMLDADGNIAQAGGNITTITPTEYLFKDRAASHKRSTNKLKTYLDAIKSVQDVYGYVGISPLTKELGVTEGHTSKVIRRLERGGFIEITAVQKSYGSLRGGFIISITAKQPKEYYRT